MEIVLTKSAYMLKQHRDITPLILSILLLLGIVILAFLRHGHGIGAWVKWPVDVDLIFVGLYVVWMLVESRIAKKDAITEGKQTLDFGTCELYALGQVCTFLTALWFPSIWHAPIAAHFWGILIFLCGVLYRFWAIRTLGQFYSHRVRKVAEHQIVNSGPYCFIRHPAYAGMVIANAGLTLYFFNWVTMSVFLVVLVPSIILRILVEEKMLFEIEGYSNYAKEREIINYADKRVLHDRIVNLTERVQDLVQRYGATEEIKNLILQNESQVFAIEKKIEGCRAIDLDSVIQRVQTGR